MTEHNIFQEVQEDLERQKLEAMWKQYGGWIIAAALAVLLGTAGSTAYRSWMADKDQKLTSELLAVSKTDPDASKSMAALQKFADENPNTNHSAFALLQAGGIAAEQNDKTKAVQYYDAAAADTKADEAFRQLGDLLSVQIQMDGGDAAQLSTRLDPLTAEKGAWRYSALEDQAYLALREGNKEKALQIFKDLSQDANVPPTIAQRATDIARSLNQ